MELVTRQTRARKAAERWKIQYLSGENDVRYNKLLSLGDNPNPDDVDSIIGTTSWTSVPQCNECGAHTDMVIMIGEELGHDSYTAHVCCRCLVRALALIWPKED